MRSRSNRLSEGSSYGNPGEAIHQALMVPERLEGFVGDGSEDRPCTHVIVDRIEDLDVRFKQPLDLLVFRG